VQNVVFDLARDKILTLFMRPPWLLGRLCSSFRDLEFVGEDFLRELFGAPLITLPIRGGISGSCCPAPSACGRSESRRAWQIVSWCSGEGADVLGRAEIPKTSEPCRYPFGSDFVTRFLLLWCFASVESLVRGNIRINRDIPDGTMSARLTSTRRSSVARFAQHPGLRTLLE
jgi:hypothetical protein